MKREHTLAILVRNQPGVLTKIASMFYRYNYNIESITVGKTETTGLSKILISLPVDERDIELLRRQVEKLVDAKWARLLDRQQSIAMEVCLIRIAYASSEERRRIMTAAEPYTPRLRRSSEKSITLEVTDSPEMIDEFVSVMKEHVIFDLSRTGMTALGPELPPVEREVDTTCHT